MMRFGGASGFRFRLDSIIISRFERAACAVRARRVVCVCWLAFVAEVVEAIVAEIETNDCF